MATIKQIQFKRTTKAGVKPTAAQLEEGELGINLKDRILYTKDDSGSIIDLGLASGGNINGTINHTGAYNQTGNNSITGKLDVSSDLSAWTVRTDYRVLMTRNQVNTNPYAIMCRSDDPPENRPSTSINIGEWQYRTTSASSDPYGGLLLGTFGVRRVPQGGAQTYMYARTVSADSKSSTTTSQIECNADLALTRVINGGLQVATEDGITIPTQSNNYLTMTRTSRGALRTEGDGSSSYNSSLVRAGTMSADYSLGILNSSTTENFGFMRVLKSRTGNGVDGYAWLDKDGQWATNQSVVEYRSANIRTTGPAQHDYLGYYKSYQADNLPTSATVVATTAYRVQSTADDTRTTWFQNTIASTQAILNPSGAGTLRFDARDSKQSTKARIDIEGEEGRVSVNVGSFQVSGGYDLQPTVSGSIRGKNGAIILRDHNNGNVSLSASLNTADTTTGGALYVGYNGGGSYTSKVIIPVQLEVASNVTITGNTTVGGTATFNGTSNFSNIDVKGRFNGTSMFSGTIMDYSADAFKMLYGTSAENPSKTGKGVLFRSDGATFYLMTTSADNPGGSYDGNRPFQFNLNSGAVELGYYAGSGDTLVHNIVNIRGDLSIRRSALFYSDATFNTAVNIKGTATFDNEIIGAKTIRATAGIQSRTGSIETWADGNAHLWFKESTGGEKATIWADTSGNLNARSKGSRFLLSTSVEANKLITKTGEVELRHDTAGIVKFMTGNGATEKGRVAISPDGSISLSAASSKVGFGNNDLSAIKTLTVSSTLRADNISVAGDIVSDIGALTVNGNIVTRIGSITAFQSIYTNGDGNSHLWFHTTSGAEKAVIWADGLKKLNIRTNDRNSSQSWEFGNTGMIFSKQSVYGEDQAMLRGEVEGGGHNDWYRRASGLQVDCPQAHTSAYNIWKATKWNSGHIAAMDVHRPGDNDSSAIVRLIVAGQAYKFFGEGTFDNPGNINANDVYIRSDVRLKRNFVKITSALDKVDQLNGHVYEKKQTLDSEEYTSKEAGLIAQELQEVLPEAVHENKETSVLTISPSAVNALLVEAIKELRQEVENLKAQIKGA